MKTATITLEFTIPDSGKLIALSSKAIECHGNGASPDEENPLSSRIVELLLLSNPNLKSFLDYGIELQNQILLDGETAPEPRNAREK